MRTVTNVVSPIKALFDRIHSMYPELVWVYSDLDVTSIVTRLRAHKVYKDTPPNIVFGFNRTPVKVSEILNGRSRKTAVGLVSDRTLGIHRSVYGQTTITFNVYFKTVEEMEDFEIAYAAHDGISGITSVGVDIPELSSDPFNYHLFWSDLDSIESPDQDIYKIGLSGSVNIDGWFLSVSTSESRISSIITTIMDYNNQVLSRIEVP